MPETPKAPRTPRSNKPTTPEEFPVAPPQPSGDYSYTLEIVMNMQHSMGKLSEAVESLKADSREHRLKLDDLSSNIRAAKSVLYVLGVLLTTIAGLIVFSVNTYLTIHKH